MGPRTYSVQRRAREPLLQFMLDALRGSGCSILKCSDPAEAPFRIALEAPDGERLGVIAYAFNANQRVTNGRPSDEHRFQVKYGREDREGKELHELWQDPFGLYTTVLIGINTERGYLVGADPVLHNPTRFFISIEFKEAHAQDIEARGWHAWERERRRADEPTEVLVGLRPEYLLDYIRFERAAKGLSQGHRQLLAEKFGDVQNLSLPLGERNGADEQEASSRLHELASEFQLGTGEILDLIQSAPRLKMAVRGWVAERHLLEQLQSIGELEECWPLEGEGQPDIAVRLPGSEPVLIECKNVLRKPYADGTCKLDFQRTRAAKGDPCSRYYARDEFQVVAACLHPVTESWEFRYAMTDWLGSHDRCPGRIQHRLAIDDTWSADALSAIRASLGAS